MEKSDIEIDKQRKMAVTWSVTVLIIFPILIVLGLLMRLNQGELINLNTNTFYAIMTLHGLGMAGILFSGAFAGIWYVLAKRYCSLNIKVMYFMYVSTLVGVALLIIATLIGGFAAGWYVLYPLPFKSMGAWPHWATGMSIVSLIILGVTWIVGLLHLLYGMVKEYGLINVLGWQYLTKKKKNFREVPPIILITTASSLAGVIAFLGGAVLLLMYLFQFFEPSLTFNALILKNLVFLFGHTLVNITLYIGVGWVYELLPEYTKRPWKTNKIIVYSWNLTFILVLFAFFHHMYMDFAQPIAFQFAGQLASYLSAVPATVVTMFGVIAQFYHSDIKWKITPLCFLMGTVGWAIGGFAAVVDSTIQVNEVFHNTLWVPAHFHTYFIVGFVLFLIGFYFYLFTPKDYKHEKDAYLPFWIIVISAYGFLLMFYLGGINSIPRRFSNYMSIPLKHVHQTGELLAQIAVVFVSLILVGIIILYISLFRRLAKSVSLSKNRV